jgi:hypothetical protein
MRGPAPEAGEKGVAAGLRARRAPEEEPDVRD